MYRLRWSDGSLVQPHELPLAFTLLLITRPQCPCVTQETNLDQLHNYNIRVVQSREHSGKVTAACVQKQNGCNSWSEFDFLSPSLLTIESAADYIPVCLTDLIEKHPELPSEIYFEQPDDHPGPGELCAPCSLI
jgi:hypothetical protein